MIDLNECKCFFVLFINCLICFVCSFVCVCGREGVSYKLNVDESIMCICVIIINWLSTKVSCVFTCLQ